MEENLTELIEKYKNKIDSISGVNEKEIFNNFYDNIDRNIIEIWIKDTFTTKSIKCLDKSTEYRNLGNQDFKQANYDAALKNYSESLYYAPFDSDNFSLALANRSAVFFIQKNYKSCILDAKECLKNNYPNNLKYKIYLRLVNSYLEICSYEDAIENIEKLKKYLENKNIDIDDVKREQVLIEIQEIEKGIIENKSLEKTETSEEKTNFPNLEKNKNFVSNFISLQCTDSKGRHVTANHDLKMGEILFIEKPFSFVPILQEHPEKIYCYHCFTTTDCPIPCKNCKTLFCSFKCFNKSWDGYHRFECTGSCVEIWPQVGVNYLAVRMLILGAVSGYKNVFTVSQSEVEHFGGHCNNYDFVCSLVSNIEKMDKIDVFPHIVSAITVIIYLQEKTDFFDYVSDILQKIDEPTPDLRDNLPYLLGGVLLKHILQVISNASTIEHVKNDFYKLFNSSEQINESGFHFSGVALYPSVSMMNHSCDSNITNYFINDYIIVKAKYDIKRGAEIFNSYGYDCRKQVTVGRKAELKKQHYFECDCTACTFPTKPEIYHEGLLCQNCKGLSLSKEPDIYKCIICNHEFNAKNNFSYIRKAEQLFEKYERTKDLDLLKKCLDLRQKVFYKYNFSIYTTNLDLQTFYGENGDIKLWWFHTQKSLELDTEILGRNSLRTGMNFRLCLIILLRYLTSLSITEENEVEDISLIDMIINANKMFESIKNIFSLYYNENEINFDELYELLQDSTAIVTHILGKNLCTNCIDDDIDE